MQMENMYVCMGMQDETNTTKREIPHHQKWLSVALET